jgi:hypothetical protein
MDFQPSDTEKRRKIWQFQTARELNRNVFSAQSERGAVGTPGHWL